MRRFPLILLVLVGIALVAKIEFATAGTVGDAIVRRGWMRARQDLDDGLQSIDDGDDDGDAVLSVSPPATSAPAKRVRLAAVLGGNAPMAVQEQVVDDQQKELIDDQHRERIDDQKQHQIDQHRRIVAEAFTWLTLRLHALRAHCPRRIMRSFDPKEVSESRELHLNAFAESYFRDKVQLAEW